MRKTLANFLRYFLSRVSTLTPRVSALTHDIDLAILSICLSVCLSVRHVPIFYGNSLTYHHSFFTQI